MVPLWVEAFEKEIEVSRRYAAANPLKYPEAPADTDLCLKLALAHPDLDARQISRKLKEIRQARISVRVSRILYQSRMVKADGRQDVARNLGNVLEWLLTMLESDNRKAVESAYHKLERYLWGRRLANKPAVARLALVLSQIAYDALNLV